MFKSYLKIAWRSLLKNKGFTFLNIIGLSVAFGAAILLSMAALFELSYNQFHENIDDIHQVYITTQRTKGTEANTSHPIPLAPTLKDEVPGIAKITRHLEENTLLVYKDKELGADLTWVDPDFFSIFSFPVIKGNEQEPFEEGNTAVVAKEIASAVFGDENAIGSTINLMIEGEARPFKVTAIIEDAPRNSTMDFEILLNFENYPGHDEAMEDWGSSNHQVFLMLEDGVATSQFETATNSFTNLHYAEEVDNAKRDGASVDADGQYINLSLSPFKDAYFTGYSRGTATTNKSLPYIVLGIAFLILFIACVNFINMSIAKNTGRLQEIGMRKTLGAAKRHVFLQFWNESVLIFLATIIIGTLLSALLLEDFKVLFRTGATYSNTFSPALLIGSFFIFFIITLIAGGYPALLLTKLGTLQALKGKLEVKSGNALRNVLMVVQFAIAILLISGTFVLWGQLEYMRTKDLGYNKEQVVSVPLIGKKNSYTAVQLLREELSGNGNILSISGSDNALGRGKDGSAYISRLGFDYKDRVVKTHMLVVDYDYPETLDLEIVDGRTFNRDFAADSLSVVINEAMAKELGEQDPVGKRFVLSDSINYTIVGLVKDYHFSKLDKAIEPLTLFMNDDWDLYYAYIKVAPENLASSFSAIETAWKTIEPNAEFLGSFLDENIDRALRREKIMITIITSGAIVAIILSCIGLLAISLLVVNQRTKEIGVRKVVGASVVSLAVLLAKDFVKLVVIGFVIIVPFAWLAAKNWLEGYTYHVDLSVWFFVAAGILAVIIALATISTGTIRAALQNPVKNLRTE
ncbi:ABC transporter permease [Spongiivirga citrea]|uniref:FtsX-like permease family protein n=1 Tax=Spongiivirga citrea TaxID=1481457 RepID=A0A6M0CHK7_9FLAO|nr:ABC transporter permease [Spongiivirga citrea]NER17345.1 FtsX-like permease family protein [Spongiivirga citrea]